MKNYDMFVQSTLQWVGFVKDIQLLCQDIYRMSDKNPMKQELVHTLSQYLSLNDHKGEDISENKKIYLQIQKKQD